MKKSLLAVLFVALASPAVFGQFAPPIDTVFTENFDGTLGPTPLLRITIQIPPTPLDLGTTPPTSKQLEVCLSILRFILVIPSLSKRMLSPPSLTRM